MVRGREKKVMLIAFKDILEPRLCVSVSRAKRTKGNTDHSLCLPWKSEALINLKKCSEYPLICVASRRMIREE